MKLMEQKTSNLKIVAPKVVVPLTAEKKKLLAQYAEVRIHILRLCPMCIYWNVLICKYISSRGGIYLYSLLYVRTCYILYIYFLESLIQDGQYQRWLLYSPSID